VQQQLTSEMASVRQELKSDIALVQQQLTLLRNESRTNCGVDCLPGFVSVSHMDNRIGCYALTTTRSTWYDAPALCATVHPRARLAILDSREKDQAVQNYIKTKPLSFFRNCATSPGYDESAAFWMSAARQTLRDCGSPFSWITTNGDRVPLTYNAWRAPQPDCANITGHECCESCATVWLPEGYHWNDSPCDRQICSICEIPVK